jgi:outer membrane protein assembly factor BamB
MTEDGELQQVPARLNLNVEDIQRWKTRLRGVKNAVLPAHDGRSNPVVVGGVVYCVSFSPGFAFALDARTGTVLWRRKLGRLAGPTPYIAGRALLAKTSSELFCMERADGRIRWSFQPYETGGESIYTSPVVHAGRVIVADRRGTAHALDLRTGRVRWTADVGGGSSVNSTPVNDAGTLVFGTNGREAVAISAEDGGVRWRTSIDAACIAGPRVVDGEIVLHTDRVVYWLDRRNGRVRAQWTAPNDIKSAGAVASRVFVVVEDGDAGRLHVLRRGKSVREFPHPSFAMREGLRHDERTGIVYDTRIMGLGILDARTGERLVDIRGFEACLGTPVSAAGSTFVVDENVVYALANGMIRRAKALGKRRG